MADSLIAHSCQRVVDEIRAAADRMEAGGGADDLIAVMATEIVRLANTVSNLEPPTTEPRRRA